MLLTLLLLIPLATALVCRLVPRRSLIEAANVAGSLATLAAGLLVVAEVYAAGPVTELGGTLYVDALGALLIAVIVTIGFAAALYSVGYLRHDIASGEVPPGQAANYYAGYHIFLWTMLVTCAVNNLGLLWVAVEATTLISALLVGFYRTRPALEAAWKYLVLCTVGIVFALLGVLLTYYAASQALGEAASLDWTALVAVSDRLDPAVMRLAFVFALVGFGTKAGFAPLHTWLPDAHSQAPSPISAVLSGVLLNCALYAILRCHTIAVGALGPEFPSRLLLGFGLLSVAVAIPFILIQRDVKRLLAYSSVEHVGLIAVAFGLGGPLGLYAGLLHLVNHAATKALLFFTAGELVQRYGTRRIGAIRGAVQAAPLTGSLLLLGALAITGTPPFGIFVSEFSILWAGVAQGQWLVAAAVALMLAAVFAAFFGHAAAMALGRSSQPAPDESHGRAPLPRLSALALALPAAGVLLLGLYVPPPLSDAIQQVVRLFGGSS